VRFAVEQELVPYEPGFPPGTRWLVVAPHPDDETVGAGATLALGVARGVAVRVLVLTDGQAQGEPELRRREALAAAAVLGVSQVGFAALADRNLAAQVRRVVELLQRELAAFPADLVFLPSPVELHPDHRATAWAGQRALRQLLRWGVRSGPPRWVAFYEVGSALWPNLLVAGDAAWEQKRRALACYASQLAVRGYDRVMEGLGAFRSLTLSGVERAEAFVLLPARSLLLRSFRSWQRSVSPPRG
jgi:LmbE family N-acetylglucosaminyl deacetylase